MHQNATIRLGLALCALGRQGEAIPYFEDALRVEPDNAAARIDLGIAQHQLGEDRRAVQNFTRAIALHPAQSTGTLVLVGKLFLQAGQLRSLPPFRPVLSVF